MMDQRPGICSRPSLCSAARHLFSAQVLSGRLYRLKNEELEVGCFRYIQQDGVVGRLLPCFNLLEVDAGIVCGLIDLFEKELGRHKVRTSAGGQIASTWEQTEGQFVYPAVAIARIADGLP